MGMDARVYTILGYDFTPWRDEMYTDEWAENEDNDKWYESPIRDEVQLFTDSMSGIDLYFGYILADGDPNEFDMTEHALSKIISLSAVVDKKLLETGLRLPKDMPPIGIITFVEWT